MAAFNDSELERYARHLVLPEIGGSGQQKLKQARVLIVGAGGLGAPVIQYLAAAGVGTIGIADPDTVSLSNLQRQIIHTTDRIGEPKTESARQSVAALNPHIEVITHPVRLDISNIETIIADYDLVLDGTDNFATRYLVSDACFFTQKPLVTAAVGRFDGSVTVINPFALNADGNLGPTYRCLYPVEPAPGSIPACAEAGILGVVTGIVGCTQALEAIKLITGAGEPLVGRLLMIDTLATRFDTIRYKRDPNNPLNGDGDCWSSLADRTG